MGIKEIIKTIGDKIPEWTNLVLTKIEESGLTANNISARLISILIILGIVWIVLHLVSGIKKPLTWVIKIAAIVLIVSIIISTFIL